MALQEITLAEAFKEAGMRLFLPASGIWVRMKLSGSSIKDLMSIEEAGRRSNDMRMEQSIAIIFLMIQVRLMISQVNSQKNLPL